MDTRVNGITESGYEKETTVIDINNESHVEITRHHVKIKTIDNSFTGLEDISYEVWYFYRDKKTWVCSFRDSRLLNFFYSSVTWERLPPLE